MDEYAVVDKRNKTQVSDNNLTSYDDYPSSSGYYSSVQNAITENAVSNSMYSKLDRSQAPNVLLLKSNKEAMKPTDFKHSNEKLSTTHNSENQKEFANKSFLVLIGFIVVLFGLVAAVIALVIAFVRIANLQEDITALSMKTCNSSESSSTTFTELYTSILQFISKSEKKLNYLRDDTHVRLNELENKINNLSEIKNTLPQILSEVDTNMSEIYRNSIERFDGHFSNITNLVRVSTELIRNYANNASVSIQTIVDDFASVIVRDTQKIFVFESCSTLHNLSLPFSSGIYQVRSSNGSSIEMYCDNEVPLTCQNVTGGWRRIAYLDIDETSRPQCPSELEIRNNPLSCRRNNISAGCSSVIYPVRGMYRCIHGRIVARQSGNPDGFVPPASDRQARNSSINGNYVDGVSLTYGNPRQHIWTFAATVNFMMPVNCRSCRNYIPPFIGSNYVCDVFGSCGNGTSICTDPLWTGGSCPPSNSTFYRQLSQPTSDDIELRVCRDQDRDDEDSLLTLVEIYVQ